MSAIIDVEMALHAAGRSPKLALGLLSQVGLEPCPHHVAQLSGGMRKRVALARAVIRQPKILLYDEPTTGLDPLTTFQVDQLIITARAKLKVTSVVISHDIASAFRIADVFL